MSNREIARALVDKHEASYNRAGMLEGAYDLDIEDLITAALDEKDKECRAKLGDMDHRLYHLCEKSGLHAHTKREGDMLVCKHCGAGVIAPDKAEQYGFDAPSTDSK